MDRLKSSPTLTCNGLQVGQSWIPPFEAGPGEIVKIVFPPCHSPDMHIAEQALWRESSRTCRTSTVELAQPPDRWREIFRPQSAAEWLIANCGISRQDAVERLNRLEVHPDAALSQLAGNPRWMIGFIAAMHRSPAALVFTTTGCDPRGMQSALEIVHSQLQETAAIYLTCFPELKITEPPYAAVLQVQTLEQTVAETVGGHATSDCVDD